MPRTRNVSRSQWDAANAQHNSRASKENAYDSEKENASRVVEPTTRAGTRRRVLGASSAVPLSSSASRAKAKGKGKEKPPPKGTSTKSEKLPLQDITRRFLPAPESANRGYPQPSDSLLTQPEVINIQGSTVSPLVFSGLEVLRSEGSRGLTSTRRSVPRANVYPSSLPPSSPPSATSEAPQELEPSDLPVLPPSPPLPKLSRRLFTQTEVEEPSYNAWSDFDYVVKESDIASKAEKTPRNSDPFGFFALEKKLQEERELDEQEEEEETGGLVLVADTSSPRPVRRLRPQFVLPAEEEVGSEQDTSCEEDEAEEEPHKFPPTPHKAKGRAIHSFSGGTLENLFSPRPSSCPSSPSPSKPGTSSSAKRKAASNRLMDEEEFEQESQSVIASQKVPGKKKAKLESDSGEPSGQRQLRSGSRHQKPESSKTALGATGIEGKRKGCSTKQVGDAAKKSKSKKGSKNVDDPDVEQWERERQVRLEYYRQLEEYDFETENVYVV